MILPKTILYSFVRDFDDEHTLIRWRVPIKLSFDRWVHIFVKHVEETKFAEGAFTKRTFFKYEAEQLFSLLKIVLKNEEEKIKQHFNLNTPIEFQGENKNDYINNWIKYNEDIFALAIDKKGYITKFHQKN